MYELRGKLSSEDELAPYVLENDRESLIKQLDEMENWLYEEGEDCSRQIYQDKLTELKSKGEPIQCRKVESEVRPVVIEHFAKSLQLTSKALEQMKQKNPKYNHISDEEVQKVEQTLRQSYEWLEQVRSKLINTPKHLQPPVTVQQIRQEKTNFENIVNPIINKPLPKAPTPPKEESAGDTKPQEQQQQNHTQQNQQQQQQNHDQENMEWQTD